MPEELKDIPVSSLFAENQKECDDEILRDIFNDRDRELIKQISIPRRSTVDSWVWLFDDRGEFTVRSCYRRLRGESACPDRDFWKKLWRLRLPGKVINFLWRTCRNCLPTAAALVTKNVNVSSLCSWCLSDVEDDKHVLFDCKFAVEVWREMGLENLINVQPNDSVMTVLQRILQARSKEQIGMVGLICWNLWNRRNCWVWDRVNTSIFGLKSRIFHMVADWNKAQEEKQKTAAIHQTGHRRWTKPPAGRIKINTDAACVTGADHLGIGCVARDETGRFLRARCVTIQGQMQPREAEAIGLREALSWIKPWRNSKCIFECDAKMVVDAVNGDRGSSNFDMLVEDCIDIMKHFDEVLVVFAYRSANNVAHLLAKAAYSMSGLQEWLYTAPDFISCNLGSEEV